MQNIKCKMFNETRNRSHQLHCQFCIVHFAFCNLVFPLQSKFNCLPILPFSSQLFSPVS